MSIFLRHLFLILLIAASGISYAQKEHTLAQKNPTIGTNIVHSTSDTLKFRLDCTPRTSYKKASILIRSSSGKEVFLVDSLPSVQSTHMKQWIDTMKVYKSSDKELLKYGNLKEFGMILLVIKDEYFSDILNSFGVNEKKKL